MKPTTFGIGALLLLLGLAASAAADPPAPAKVYAVGEELLAPAPPISASDLGQGLGANFRQFKPGTVEDYPRVYPNRGAGNGPGNVERVVRKEYRSRLYDITDRAKLDASYRVFFVGGDLHYDATERYIFQEVYYVDHVLRLNTEDSRVAGTASVTPVEVWMGWKYVVIIHGDETDFSGEVKAGLFRVGVNLEAEAKKHRLAVEQHHFGLRPKPGHEFTYSDDPKVIADSFEVGDEPVPIFVNYRWLVQYNAEPIAWTPKVPTFAEAGTIGGFSGDKVNWMQYTGGFRLQQIAVDGPLASSGLKGGGTDRILKIDGGWVTTRAEIETALAKHRVGETVEFTYVRSNERNNDGAQKALVKILRRISYSDEGFLGIQWADTANGVEVQGVIPDTMASHTSLKAGDILRSVDDITTPKIETIFEVLKLRSVHDLVKLRVLRDGKEVDEWVTVGKRKLAGDWMRTAAECRRTGDNAGAIRACTEALKLDADSEDALVTRADCYRMTGKLREAIADATELIRRNPKLGVAWRIRGLARSSSSDTPGAISDCDTAVQLEPANFLAWYNRGVVKMTTQPKEALADLARSLLLNPGNTHARFLHGQLLVQLGQRDAGIAEMRAAIEAEPDGDRKERWLTAFKQVTEGQPATPALAPKWSGSWSGSGQVWMFELELDVQPGGACAGTITWSRIENGRSVHQGVERVRGNYDAATRVLTLKGYAKEGNVGLDEYRLTLNAAGTSITGRSRGSDGKWQSELAATRK